MKKIFFLITFIFLFNCSNEKEYDKFAISYTDLTKLNTKSFLKIDNHIIGHSSSAKVLRYKKALPLAYVNMFDSKMKNSPVIKTKHNMVLESLRDILLKTNEYNFDSVMYLEQIKKIIISRKDKEKVKIKTSKGYPATFVPIK